MGERDVRLPVLLFALLGAPLAWTLHFLVSYFLVALFCAAAWEGAGVAIGVATVASAAVSAASGVVAYRTWRTRRNGQTRSWDAALTEPRGWAAFVLVMGMLGSALFTALIVLEAVPPLFVPTCSEVAA
jgi:small-conductance mechanosensitive channel